MIETPGWRQLTLDEIALGGLFSDGDWVESKDQDPSGAVRLTQLADVGEGYFRDRSNRWLREDQASRMSCTFLEPDDILIARMPDPLGRSCLVPATIGRAVTVVDVAILRIARDDIEPRFVMWAINSPSFRRRVEALQSGTTRKRISRRNLASLRLSIPSIHEQRRIVDVLEDHISRLDAAAASMRSAKRSLDALWAAGLWAATHDLGGQILRLDQVAEVRLGRQRSPQNHTGDFMRPYLRAGNVDWDRLRLDDVKSMNFTDAETNVFELRDGDVLVVEASGSAGEVGKSAIYRGEVPGACFQNTLLRLRCHAAEPEYVQKYLLAEGLLGRFTSGARGVGIHHIGRTRLASWPIELPNADRQQVAIQRGRILQDACNRLHSQLNSHRSRAHSLRRAVLSAAFSGGLSGSRSKALSEERLYV